MNVNSNISGKERGFTLIESLMALFLLGLSVIAILSALAAGAKASIIGNEQAIAESLARSQLETIKNAPFSSVADYPLVNPPPYWSVVPAYSAAFNSSLNQLQKTDVVITHRGKQVFSITTYKADKGE